MNKNQKIILILVVGGLAVIGLCLIDVFFALIVLVLVLVLLMSVHIMEDSGNYPLVVAELSEDAREVIVINAGTAVAQNIRVTLVPLDIDFNVASLGPDSETGFGLASMISEAKAIVRYENADGQEFMRTYPLTALGAGRDPTEPLFPIFGRR